MDRADALPKPSWTPPAFTSHALAYHDAAGNFVAVDYRIHEGECTRLAREVVVEVGAPPEAFQAAYLEMKRGCAALNKTAAAP